MNEHYSGEQLGNHHKKNGKGKLTLFCGNVERLIPIYGRHGGPKRRESLLHLLLWNFKTIQTPQSVTSYIIQLPYSSRIQYPS